MQTLSFARPDLLWALLAGVLPLLIHLINRHRARRHPFAAIDFLFRVQRRSARRILLRQLLLLLIRTLLIAALILAAAGPVLSDRPSAAGDGSPTTTVLVLDRSFSMRATDDGRSRFEAARDQARHLIQSLSPPDRACLLLVGDTRERAVDPCTDSPTTLLDALERAEPGWGGGNLSAAIEDASGMLERAPAGRHRILLLSDAAAHAFPTPPELGAADPPEVLLRDVAEDRARANHQVEEIRVGPGGAGVELQVRLGGCGAEAEQEFPIDVLFGEQTPVRGFVGLPACGSTTKIFSLQSPPQQATLGEVRLQPDGLAEDDSRPFFVGSHRGIRALLVNGDLRSVLHQDELFYLERALAPTGFSAGVQYTAVPAERFRPELLDDAEVVFLANVRELGARGIEALRAFVAGGGGLFVALGDRISVERTGEELSVLLPWRLRDLVSLGPAEPDGSFRQGEGFGEFDPSHPVLSIFGPAPQTSLGAVRATRAAVLEPGAGLTRGQVLIRFGNGAPALLAGDWAGGRVMLLTTTLDRDWNNWPARSSFLPFIQRACAWLAGRLEELPPPEVTVGEVVRLPLPPGAAGFRIREPAGDWRDVPSPERDGDSALWRDTGRPGWTEVQVIGPDGSPWPGRSVPGFLVHPPTRESDLRPVSAARLQALLGSRARFFGRGDGTDHPRSRAGVLLLLALCCVLLEAVLVRR